jgi:hypothetical protein
LLDDGWSWCLGLDDDYRRALLRVVGLLRLWRVGLLNRLRVGLLNGSGLPLHRGWGGIGVVEAGDHLGLVLDFGLGGDADVVEEFDGETGLGFEHRVGSAARKVDEVDGPENRDEPLDGVAGCVSGPEDAAIGVDPVLPESAMTRVERGMTVSFPTTMRSNLSSIQPFPTKCPGSL